nr:transposase, Ptta/En/Spm, transposase, Tnp1/En/Spm-like protein [Tanacetum cinerariifolium]
MRRNERVTENALDAVIQTISLAIVQNHLATKIKRPSLEVLGAIAKMTPKTKLTMKLVSMFNHQMRGKKERVKSIALKAKKESSDDEPSTSRSDDEEYVMAVRNFRKFFRRKGKFVRQPREEKKSF